MERRDRWNINLITRRLLLFILDLLDLTDARRRYYGRDVFGCVRVIRYANIYRIWLGYGRLAEAVISHYELDGKSCISSVSLRMFTKEKHLWVIN